MDFISIQDVSFILYKLTLIFLLFAFAQFQRRIFCSGSRLRCRPWAWKQNELQRVIIGVGVLPSPENKMPENGALPPWAPFTQNTEADFHTNLLANHLMLLAMLCELQLVTMCSIFCLQHLWAPPRPVWMGPYFQDSCLDPEKVMTIQKARSTERVLFPFATDSWIFQWLPRQEMRSSNFSFGRKGAFAVMWHWLPLLDPFSPSRLVNLIQFNYHFPNVEIESGGAVISYTNIFIDKSVHIKAWKKHCLMRVQIRREMTTEETQRKVLESFLQILNLSAGYFCKTQLFKTDCHCWRSN